MVWKSLGTLAVAVGLAVTLAGCEGLYAGAETAIDAAKAAGDARSRVAVSAQCGATVGGLQRGFTSRVQRNVWDTCQDLNNQDADPFPGGEDPGMDTGDEIE